MRHPSSHLRVDGEGEDPVGRLHSGGEQAEDEAVVDRRVKVSGEVLRGHVVDDAVLDVLVGELPHLPVAQRAPPSPSAAAPPAAGLLDDAHDGAGAGRPQDEVDGVAVGQPRELRGVEVALRDGRPLPIPVGAAEAGGEALPLPQQRDHLHLEALLPQHGVTVLRCNSVHLEMPQKLCSK